MKQLNSLLNELLQVCCLNRIYLIDNSPIPTDNITPADKITYLFQNTNNLGYGKAHNIALKLSIQNNIPLHLVINPDVQVRHADIDQLCDLMTANPQIGQLMPHVTYPDGSTQFLCKKLPTPLDLFARRFLPKKINAKRTQQYELRDTGYDKIMNVPYLSGCFMMLQTKAVQKAGLFDQRYFMYPEDIDLTRSIHRHFLTIYYPKVTIIHNHQQSSYKNLKMLLIHIINICRYFNKYGWLYDPERKLFNSQAPSFPTIIA